MGITNVLEVPFTIYRVPADYDGGTRHRNDLETVLNMVLIATVKWVDAKNGRLQVDMNLATGEIVIDRTVKVRRQDAAGNERRTRRTYAVPGSYVLVEHVTETLWVVPELKFRKLQRRLRGPAGAGALGGKAGFLTKGHQQGRRVMKRSDFFRSVFAIAGGAVAGIGATGAAMVRWRRPEITKEPGQVIRIDDTMDTMYVLDADLDKVYAYKVGGPDLTDGIQGAAKRAWLREARKQVPKLLGSE